MLEFTLTLFKTIQRILIAIWAFVKKYSIIIFEKVRQLVEEYQQKIKEKQNSKKDGN